MTRHVNVSGPPRHAAIRNWPSVGDDPILLKAEEKKLAILLASNARVLEK
jgi:hypothetical protein